MKKKIISFVLAIVLVICTAVPVLAVSTPYSDSQFFREGDYTIHYRVAEHSGAYHGRIMMLHGFMCSTYAWRNMSAGFTAQGYDCIMVDLPNFGYSTRESAAVRHIDREQLVLDLMKSFGGDDPWILAGHSMGGGVCVNIAEMTDNVEALLLYCPAVQSTMPKSMESVFSSNLLHTFMDSFFTVGTSIKPVVRFVVYMATMNWKFAKDYDLSGVTAPFSYKGIGTGMCTMITTVRPTNLEDAKNIHVPVLLVNADRDLILDSGSKTLFKDALPNAESYVVKGGGHQCIEDRAEELVKVSCDFLNR